MKKQKTVKIWKMRLFFQVFKHVWAFYFTQYKQQLNFERNLHSGFRDVVQQICDKMRQNCGFDDEIWYTLVQFGTLLEYYVTNIFRYRDIADSAYGHNGGHCFKMADFYYRNIKIWGEIHVHIVIKHR